MLEYAEPIKAISNLHERNSERLDKFSTILNLRKVEGCREVSRDITVYSFKGLLEICRYSQQPKANDIMDWLFDVADEIRRTGSYSIKQDYPIAQIDPMQVAKTVLEPAKIEGNQLALALDKVGQHYTGQSILALYGINLIAPVQCQILNPTQIGKHFGVSARKVNQVLIDGGYQIKTDAGYEPTELGEPYAVMLDVNKPHSDGTPIRQLKWNSDILDEITCLF